MNRRRRQIGLEQGMELVVEGARTLHHRDVLRDTLPRVAQYIAVMKGSGPLYDELHSLLETDLPPTPVHRFFASLPPLLRERGSLHQLIVTTSYDLALERAFLDAGEEFDVVSYLAAGRNRGKL